jgi:hypothetical protein
MSSGDKTEQDLTFLVAPSIGNIVLVLDQLLRRMQSRHLQTWRS